MKISELIDILKRLKEFHGDINVMTTEYQSENDMYFINHEYIETPIKFGDIYYNKKLNSIIIDPY